MGLNYGIPQGSVLGPSLFSIHYDGLQTSVEQSHCTLYADDTEIHASNASAAAGAASVNYHLQNIDQWLFENQMVPQPGKSQTMKIGSLPALRLSENIDICLNNCKLNEVDAA